MNVIKDKATLTEIWANEKFVFLLNREDVSLLKKFLCESKISDDKKIEIKCEVKVK